MKGKKWIAVTLIGLALFAEHYWRYGGFDYELLGHEIYGLALMVIGLLRFYWVNRKSDKFRWDSKEPPQHTS